MRFLTRIRRKCSTCIPAVDPFDCIDGNLPISLQYYKFVKGSLTLYERVILNSLVKKYAPEVIFEIGTFNGRTTFNMAMNSPEETHIYTLDLPRDMIDSTHLCLEGMDKQYIDKEVSGGEFKGTSCEKKITQLFGDTAAFNFSPFYCSVDFVFVDASHSYEYVKHDSQVALKLRRNKQAIILWHDYGRTEEWPGVTRLLNELYKSKDDFKSLRHIRGTSFVILIEE